MALAYGGDARGGQAVSVEVEVSGLRGTNGALRVGMFQRAGFPRDEAMAVRGAVAAVTGGVTVVTVDGIEPGEYAILLYHDENANGRLDYDRMGRPREGYGVSGAARRTWRAPRFDEAKILISAGTARIRVPVAY